MIKVKICGITNIDDAMAAVEYGADALGFIFVKSSPRFISPGDARDIIKKLPPFIKTVGVFVDEPPRNIDEVIAVSGVDILQLHGDETPGICIEMKRPVVKAVRVKSRDSLRLLPIYKEHVSAILLDTYSKDMHGGTGETFNWDIAVEAVKSCRIILSGGLTPDNVREGVRYVNPYAVDVSSGVESAKGRKDHSRLKLFIERAKSAVI